jgi:DNA-binding NarL/FixJ family response regulator
MLSPRQTQVCEGLASGLPDKAIAQKLRISEETVNFHLRRVFEKFRVHKRSEAAIVYLKVKSDQLIFDQLTRSARRQ